MQSNNNFSRRKVLKSLGGTLAASGLIGQAAAQPSPREIYQRGLEIWEKTGKREQFEQYILNRGFKIAQQNSETHDFRNNSGNITPRHAEPSDLTLYASVYSSNGVTYSNGSWEVQRDLSDAWNDFDDAAQQPKDIVGIGWEHTDYDIKWNTWDSSKYTSQRMATTNNVAWEFDDYTANTNQVTGSGLLFYGFASVELTGTNPIGQRSIIVNYQHTWVGGKVTSISFDTSGAMGIGVSYETKKWNTPRQAHSNDG